jgi:hypothetical protein
VKRTARLATLPLFLAVAPGCGSSAIPLRDLDSHQWVWPYFVKEQPTVLAFWSVDELQCIKDMPALNALERREGVVQLVTVCTSRERLEIELWLRKEEARFLVLLDPDERLARRLRVTSYPTYIFFDMNGAEIARQNDVRTVHHWFDRERWITRALAGRG